MLNYQLKSELVLVIEYFWQLQTFLNLFTEFARAGVQRLLKIILDPSNSKLLDMAFKILPSDTIKPLK